ncbi:hypothetical protein [Gordonia otitidis]|uniref:2,4-diaminopentanoate dehydrogenase C-terminal domain-containing protein n=1 Tax=Gordonia otitidis (strain DSM 44809 / CCUG 52243 / JCM 12355 / NBRC 100426 / IFM 10032) TaxID=1108044 RepID=H5TN96_GORO1|nr:hypothetical protein [Gordonia otitidis]UEA60353.1 hypothetical protein LK459_05705 [Gordonia otitidis]GAB34954.1 hypothetical protein GOOTI_130_00470 [Gordonia otitidis NBRC 100426]
MTSVSESSADSSSAATRPLRVIQWATGNVGQASLRALIGNPAFDLVGVYVYSDDKEGRDVGELAGLAPAALRATHDREAILALDADAVVYNALGDTGDAEQCVDDICALLASGKNVVSTAVSTHIHPASMPPGVADRISAACAAGNASFHSSGVNPGFAFDILPVVVSTIGDRIDSIDITELVDMSGYDSASVVRDMIGMGLSPDTLAPMDFLTDVTWSPYYACIALLQQAFSVTFEDFAITCEKATTPVPVTLPWGTIDAGTVAARRIDIEGIVDGTRRLGYHMVWRVSDDVAPEWPSGAAHYELSLQGDPRIDVRLDITSPSGRGTSIATAMHAVNAVEPVCAAPPGIITRLDLGLHAGGYLPVADSVARSAVREQAGV